MASLKYMTKAWNIGAQLNVHIHCGVTLWGGDNQIEVHVHAINHKKLQRDHTRATKKQEQLAVAVAMAEIALARTLTDIHEGVMEADKSAARVEAARAYCRRTRASLVAFECANPTVASTARFEPPATGTLSRLPQAAAPAEALKTIPALVAESRADLSGRVVQKPLNRVEAKAHLTAIRRLDMQAALRSPLFRQTLGLFALVLAFLLYFHIDVQLQIVSMPSAFF